eukprot:TRINITY_DN4602_c0_g1_i2.p1 TRINITY_DN4602_c0_g1~~TRINITY_DN4602_c0_g1_i2.p1  ORF type:complete len:554 (+),score=122.83 TRINITY_DN4602_c0_g1_i2:77-1738(+)
MGCGASLLDAMNKMPDGAWRFTTVMENGEVWQMRGNTESKSIECNKEGNGHVNPFKIMDSGDGWYRLKCVWEAKLHPVFRAGNGVELRAEQEFDFNEAEPNLGDAGYFKPWPQYKDGKVIGYKFYSKSTPDDGSDFKVLTCTSGGAYVEPDGRKGGQIWRPVGHVVESEPMWMMDPMPEEGSAPFPPPKAEVPEVAEVPAVDMQVPAMQVQLPVVDLMTPDPHAVLQVPNMTAEMGVVMGGDGLSMGGGGMSMSVGGDGGGGSRGPPQDWFGELDPNGEGPPPIDEKAPPSPMLEFKCKNTLWVPMIGEVKMLYYLNSLSQWEVSCVPEDFPALERPCIKSFALGVKLEPVETRSKGEWRFEKIDEKAPYFPCPGGGDSAHPMCPYKGRQSINGKDCWHHAMDLNVMKVELWHTCEDSLIRLAKTTMPMMGDMWIYFEDFEFGECMKEVEHLVCDLRGLYQLALPKVEIEGELETVKLQARIKMARAKICLLALETCGPLPGISWADTGYGYKCSSGGLILSYEDSEKFLEMYKQLQDLSEEHAALLQECAFE